MKQKIKELALQAGGSHYPDVGGELLEKFADLVISECIDAVNNADCNNFTFTTFDIDRVKSVKARAISSINKRFAE